MKIGLLISTYNWPEALELIFKSIKIQSLLPDEIAIADDGSSQETKNLIDNFRSKTGFVIHHLWQEDNGFRKAKILNKTVSQFNVDYIIQIDGDIIMHKHFIKDHIQFAKRGLYLYGSRANIKESKLAFLFKKKQVAFHFLSKGIKKRGRLIHIPLLCYFFKPSNKLSSKLRGCNFSFWKDDFIKVNGLNEDFIGWGEEDSEFALRLHMLGIKAKRLKFAGLAYHIFHKEKEKVKDDLKSKLVENVQKTKHYFVPNGVNKYLQKK